MTSIDFEVTVFKFFSWKCMIRKGFGKAATVCSMQNSRILWQDLKTLDHTMMLKKCYFKPLYARINFAVPSIPTIEKMTYKTWTCQNECQKGWSSQYLNLSQKRFILCADAKKVISGVDKLEVTSMCLDMKIETLKKIDKGDLMIKLHSFKI